MRQITDVEQLEVGKRYIVQYNPRIENGWYMFKNIIAKEGDEFDDDCLDCAAAMRLGSLIFGPIPSPSELTALVRDAEKWREYVRLGDSVDFAKRWQNKS